MNENGNKYALAALKDRRATLAGEIAELKKQLVRREEMLEHVDATIRIFQPDYERGTIPLKRPRRVKLFRQGELNRMIFNALRRAEKPLSTADIVTSVINQAGYGEEARPGHVDEAQIRIRIAPGAASPVYVEAPVFIDDPPERGAELVGQSGIEGGLVHTTILGDPG